MAAMTPPKLILLEFNELTPALLERFMSEGRLPNFKRLYEESMVYTTDAEESGDTLNPWVQWGSQSIPAWITATTASSELDEGEKLPKPRGSGTSCPTRTAGLDLRQHERRV